MKKLAIIIMMILCVTCVFTACNFTQTKCKIQSEKSSYTVTIGEQVDLTSYFTITSATGENIPVTSDMIDAPNADFTKAGVFIVVCSYQGVAKSIIVRVEEPHSHVFEDATCTEPKTCSCGATDGEALGHMEVVDQAVDSTCTNTGKTEGKHCQRCGEVLVAQTTVDALGHTEPNVYGKCERCGTQLEDVGQTFDPNNHINNDDILYDAVTDYEEKQNALPSTGLLSQGTYNVLVVPVEFSDDKFTNQELTDLGNTFNNQSATGWESVNSYYKTSSYGKLNMTFDIADKVALNYTYSYFDGGSDHGENILKLALDKLDASGFDFSKYDYDSNGVVDGVYIIYSAPIDYYSDDSYYWAYVNWAQNDLVYDNMDVYTYLFASVDFMYEDVETSGSDYAIDGLVLNASTYIHETGHMLGLDDYYDYAPNTGSDKGLGCADMMDYTVGDHNAYSKLMLGWVNPIVVTQTQTVTINAFESSGQFIIVLLDYNGTYFSEYLIIDLYSATGLNEMHANVEGSYLYGGTSFGARIYHVDSTIANPRADKYESFTDNNNSMSSDALLQLIEADGDKNFESDKEYYQGQYYYYASADDLWQTGDVFSDVQPNYTRHDGKQVNFDISFDSVTAESATITITFDNNN